LKGLIVFEPTVIQYGSPTPLPDKQQLRAGPLTLRYEEGSIRYIKLGDHEVLRQIYVAVRDHNWGTIPGVLSDVEIQDRSDSFAISYKSEHKQGNIHFVWRGEITGAADGTIVFKMDGEVLSTFKRNRIGFCILHPMDCAGLACTVEEVDGATRSSAFPDSISPHQPFFNLRAITHEVVPGLRAEVRMEGDTYEMEDQRNWTDASFKTYCTPLGIPFPVTVEAGTKIAQQITLRLHGTVPQIAGGEHALTFTLGSAARPLPAIGLGVASHGQPLTPREIELLKALDLDHLRVDLRLDQPGWQSALERAAHEASAIGARLEVALHVPPEGDEALKELRGLIDRLQPSMARWLVFGTHEKSTSAETLTRARAELAEWNAAVPFGAGTNAFFTELNRERPPVDAADFVAYSLNPTVHAVDNDSLVETLAAQAETVISMRAFSDDLPIAVTPVTFRMRWNPNATGPDPELGPGELPPQVDVRQLSLLGAGWTAGSIKYLAEAGADSLTYFETTGWRGLIETEQGSQVPERFPSVAGGAFPLYHVFADLGAFRGGEVVRSYSSDRMRVDGLAVRREGKVRILLANLTDKAQTVTLPDVRGAWTLKLLDETSAEGAVREPVVYQSLPGAPIQGVDGLQLTLQPYSIARLDS
jgi:hypothetical protein